MTSASSCCRPSAARRRPPASLARHSWSVRSTSEPIWTVHVSCHTTDTATETCVAYRDLLFTVAYEMLGSAADAEDVLQEAWLRWVKVDVGQVRDQRAYLVRITTRQSLDRLRTMRRRREAYIGS